MTDKPSSAPRVKAHKARGKYVCATISPRAAGALARIQQRLDCTQREAMEIALVVYAATLPESAAMVTGGAP